MAALPRRSCGVTGDSPNDPHEQTSVPSLRSDLSSVMNRVAASGVSRVILSRLAVAQPDVSTMEWNCSVCCEVWISGPSLRAVYAVPAESTGACL